MHCMWVMVEKLLMHAVSLCVAVAILCSYSMGSFVAA